MPALQAAWEKGSSPLTRGKQSLSTWAKDIARLIPAHAGKTIALDVGKGHRQAHPRSRGENAKDVAIPALQDGSSPLTRGKRKGLSCRRDQKRLIPAHAGKT